MKRILLSFRGLAAGALIATGAMAQPASSGGAEGDAGAADVIVLIGATGNERFAPTFAAAAADWRSAAEKAGARLTLIGPTDPHSAAGEEDVGADLAAFESAMAGLAAEGPTAVWIAMVGHGTFDGKSAKFNLRGPDLTVEGLAKALGPIQRTVVVVNGAPASSPFLTGLTGPNRVVITATNNATMTSVTRLGPFFATAVADPAADLDKDDQISVLEAWLTASRRVADFYQGERRLATEQPLMDDNGDGLGARAEFFRGVRPVRQPDSGAELDGYRAHQIVLVPSDRERKLPPEVRARRDELELEIVRLRDKAEGMKEEQYLALLESYLMELAVLYRDAEGTEAESD